MEKAAQPSGRPRAVTVAVRAWWAAAVLLVAFGALLTIAAVVVRPTGSGSDGGPDGSGSVRLALGLAGALNVAVGIAVTLLARGVSRGDPRSRRALVALSVTFAFVAVALSFAPVLGLGSLIAALVMIGATVAVRRPAAVGWFAP